MKLWTAYGTEDLANAGEEAEDACERLRELGYPEIAADTEKLIEDVREFERRVEERQNGLRRYWKAISYYDASDISAERFHEAMKNGGY